jgi:hypothetical protein
VPRHRGGNVVLKAENATGDQARLRRRHERREKLTFTGLSFYKIRILGVAFSQMQKCCISHFMLHDAHRNKIKHLPS